MRKPRNSRYRLKATYIENDQEYTFWCKENKLKNITNEMGASLPLSNGERMLETDSELDFKVGQRVVIMNEDLFIQNTSHNIDDKDLNSMRGKPKYITSLLVK